MQIYLDKKTEQRIAKELKKGEKAIETLQELAMWLDKKVDQHILRYGDSTPTAIIANSIYRHVVLSMRRAGIADKPKKT